tara:strand:+ start:41 stop:283 length:243 start_codon:yes stop_codon:yes gene_type:complete
MPATYSTILKIQRDQLNQKEEELRFIAANVESLIDSLNRRVVEENATIDFDRSPLGQVFRGDHLDWAVSAQVRQGVINQG